MACFIHKTTKFLEQLAAKNILVYQAMSLYYKKLIREEIALADIKSTDRILCIGGGPCPFSGILLHEYTGAHVTIVDNDYCCVCIARQLISKLGYTESIEVLYGDGNDISPKDYTVIHMAAQVNPIQQVFCSLKRKCPYGARILVRVPKKGLKKFYSADDFSLFRNCCKKAVHNWRNIDSTALFIVA